MSKTVTATISISTDGRIQGRYFVDVRDTTAGRNRQMTTRVLDDPAPFLAELTAAATKADVAVTVTDTTGELATPEQAAESAAVVLDAKRAELAIAEGQMEAWAERAGFTFDGDDEGWRAALAADHAAALEMNARVADDLDSKKFPELMEIAKLHNVPGRGTARRAQLIAGIRAARGEADAAFRRALSAPGHVDTPQPVTAPAVLPGKAAPALVWSGRRELSGRYAVEGVARGKSTRYRGVTVSGPHFRTMLYTRLRDAQAAIQEYYEELHRAHTDAAAMETARLAGDPEWANLDGQFLDALTEDSRRTRTAREARRARPLSGFGALRAAYSQTHPAVAR